MTKKEQIEQAVETMGICTIGSYDTKLDKLTAKDIKEVCDNVKDYPTCIVKVSKGWVECEECNDEVDIRLLTNKEKLDIYGDERE